MEQRTEHIRRVPFQIWATVGSRADDVMLFASGSDILCESGEMAFPVLDAAVHHLAARRPANWLLLVGRLTDEAMALEGCRRFPRHAHYERGAVDWIRTDRSYAALHAGLSRKFKASLRNTANRAATQGLMEFRTSHSDSPDFAVGLSDFKQVEASGWKGATAKGVALATNPSSAQRDFVDAVFSRHSNSAPFVHRFLLDGKCIAALIGVRFGHTVAVLRIGYDESFRRLGPGHLLVRDLLESCCESPGIHKVDMISHTDWVASWEPEVKSYHWFYLPIRPIVATLPLALLRLPKRVGGG
jgi:hypothetical protein